jgi:hypothetical protein
MTAANTENPFAGQGSVLLDIGGEIGALVVEMPASMEGVEVEIRPRDSHVHDHVHEHSHVAVVTRPTRDAQVPSLVFPDLVEGEYELYEKEGHTIRLTATVAGGQVAQAVWPG